MILPVKVIPNDPLTLKDFMPDRLQSQLDPANDDFDPDAKALVDFLEVEILLTYDTGTSVLELLEPDKCPPQFLSDLAFDVAARLFTSDTDRQKRQKIQGAIIAHQNNGLFDLDVKPRIDAVTGKSSSLIEPDNDEWVWLGNTGDDAILENFAVWGGSGPSGDDSGFDWFGSGQEIGVAGNIFIDLGGTASDPDAATIAKVVDELTGPNKFAYLIIHLGFVVGGVFTEYSGGLI